MTPFSEPLTNARVEGEFELEQCFCGCPLGSSHQPSCPNHNRPDPKPTYVYGEVGGVKVRLRVDQITWLTTEGSDF